MGLEEVYFEGKQHGRKYKSQFKRRSTRQSSQSKIRRPDDRVQLQELISADTLKVATWNVNSIRSRLSLILSWLAEQQPDIVCLQETKAQEDQVAR